MTNTRNHFRRARLLTVLTQKAAAARAHLSQSVVSDLETGTNRNPSWETIGRLAVIYDCSPFELLPLAFRPRAARRRLLLGARGTR